MYLNSRNSIITKMKIFRKMKSLWDEFYDGKYEINMDNYCSDEFNISVNDYSVFIFCNKEEASEETKERFNRILNILFSKNNKGLFGEFDIVDPLWMKEILIKNPNVRRVSHKISCRENETNLKETLNYVKTLKKDNSNAMYIDTIERILEEYILNC